MYAGSNERVIDPLRTLLDPLKAGNGRCGHEQFTHQLVSSFPRFEKKNSTSTSPIMYHMVTVLAWQNFLIDSVTSPNHRTCSQHFRYLSQSKQNRTLFQCGCSHNDWFALYARSYSHLDELVILRSVYWLHHAADSQLVCNEDEGRHCK